MTNPTICVFDSHLIYKLAEVVDLVLHGGVVHLGDAEAEDLALVHNALLAPLKKRQKFMKP